MLIIVSTPRRYVYKLCPFDKVTQRNKDGGAETSLGDKMIWVDKETTKYTIMKYEGGTTCWNGPARSTTVSSNVRTKHTDAKN